MSVSQKWGIAVLLGVVFFWGMVVGRADAHDHATPLQKARAQHTEHISAVRRQYVQEAILAGVTPRQVRYRGSGVVEKTIKAQLIHETGVYRWQRRVYSQLLREVRAFKRTPAHLYAVLDRRGVRAMVEAAFDQQDVDAHGRYCLLEIIPRESGWNPKAINDAPGTTASGLLQFLNTWGSLAERLDPVWAISRAIRYYHSTGHFDPWTETAPGGCLS